MVNISTMVSDGLPGIVIAALLLPGLLDRTVSHHQDNLFAILIMCSRSARGYRVIVRKRPNNLFVSFFFHIGRVHDNAPEANDRGPLCDGTDIQKNGICGAVLS